ncbi:MAG: beta strand repeat-containing protein [Bryobacteraceae bacterium]
MRGRLSHFPRLSFRNRAIFIGLGLILCLASIGSAQGQISIACVPTTGPTQVGVPYLATCTATGGIAPFTWAIVAGTLPAGIALSPSADTTTATISGTPASAGAYSYTVQVTDSSPPPQPAQQAYSGTIAPVPAPVITSLNPASVAAGGPAFTLTVNGSGFGSDAVVRWNGSALATTFVDATQLTAPVPANLIVFAGVAQITVLSGGVTSNNLNFTVNPVISSLNPSSATAGAPTFTLTVNGAGFAAGSVVQWNGSPLVTNLISSTQLQATVLANLVASSGTSQVTVVSNTLTSNSVNFTVTAAPTITSIAPTTAIAGGPAFTLTVNGTGFQSGAAIQWNGNQLTTTFVSGTRMTASVPANLIANAGTAQITVRSGAVTSNAATFTINPAPVVSTISPNTATAGGPAFTLTVNGTGFTGGSTVHWNTSTLSTRFVNATQLTAAVPAALIASAGITPVTVVTGGVTSNPVNFTVIAPPVISNLSPSAATAGGPAFTLTVNGSGFGADAVVNWNQTPLATSVVSGNRLTAPVLAALIATAGTARITVSSGGVTSNAVTFTIVVGPAIGALSPASTAAGGPAFTLTVTGTGFAAGAVVRWNSTQLQTVVVSANQITAAVTADLIANVGSAQITVISGGATSNALTFAIVAAPIISTISPSSVAAGGPDFTLTVNGSGFAADTTVQWNGAPLATTVVNAAQVTAAVPANLIASFGSAQISVLSSGVASNSVAIAITAPSIVLTGVHSTTVPTQQLNVGIQLASPPPTALQGTLHLAFTPSVAGLPAGYIDPASQFAAGGRTLNFTVPAGVMTVSPLTGGTIQQGTVAGTLTVSLTSLTSNGVSVLPPTPVTATATILPLPPVITANSVHITNLTATGFDVVLTGYSTTRDMTSATFTFTANTGTQFAGSATFTVPLTAAYTAWYQSPQSQSFGSMFQLQVPFTLSGSTNVLQSVTVTLTNSIGTSTPVSGGP